jgi:ComF family protein
MQSATRASIGAATAMIDLLLPRTCAACGLANTERGIALCGKCAEDLARQVGGDYCRQCGEDVGAYLLHDGRCNGCIHRRPPLARVARVGRHRGVLRRLVLRFKHEPIHDVLLGELLATSWHRELADQGVDVVVPIPSPLSRRWRRGFHPAELLARQVARREGLLCRPLLEMARRVRPQTGLSAEDREENIRGAFRCVWPAACRGRTVCLIDDVMTTGATLREAARTLRSARSGRVVAAVIARAGLAEAADS